MTDFLKSSVVISVTQIKNPSEPVVEVSLIPWVSRFL